jgi:hypothetical protein
MFIDSVPAEMVFKFGVNADCREAYYEGLSQASIRGEVAVQNHATQSAARMPVKTSIV